MYKDNDEEVAMPTIDLLNYGTLYCTQVRGRLERQGAYNQLDQVQERDQLVANHSLH